MTQRITLGGERLGSGKKMKVALKNYERSTHDLGITWKSSMSPGTLVPFYTEVGLPGDTMDIHLDADVLTLPTVGPLFGSFKLQLDVFVIPFRLYQAKLHMNMIGIGRDMSMVKLPQIFLQADQPNPNEPIEAQQINPSCILAHLNITGLGSTEDDIDEVRRTFNAIPYLGYWDIYKTYYSNKQEGIGAVIHKNVTKGVPTFTTGEVKNTETGDITIAVAEPINWSSEILLENGVYLVINSDELDNDFDAASDVIVTWRYSGETTQRSSLLGDIFLNVDTNPDAGTITASGLNPSWNLSTINIGLVIADGAGDPYVDAQPQIVTFPLKNIDDMREILLKYFSEDPYVISNANDAPYDLIMRRKSKTGGGYVYSKQFSQEGLGLKTYNSDLFNNWIDTEFIDGEDGVSEITKIDTSSGSFKIDELNMATKIYNLLNRIAVSDGTYQDWLDVVYTHGRYITAENPMYVGGLIKEIVFQEITSTAASPDKPLGTLAGRGKLSQSKHKGGHMIIKIDEPSYVMGIVSITPRLDYSTGNKWDTNLQTMNDLHKPALDEIGFQDLITDQMAWWDTRIPEGGVGIAPPRFKSAGKQPAWINYMTNVNVVRGNFAIPTKEMFMVLVRRYEAFFETGGKLTSIKDLTTYIDPSKFNHIFADTNLDAQNFWVQIIVDNTARRKMSAKIMPNL